METNIFMFLVFWNLNLNLKYIINRDKISINILFYVMNSFIFVKITIYKIYYYYKVYNITKIIFTQNL